MKTNPYINKQLVSCEASDMGVRHGERSGYRVRHGKTAARMTPENHWARKAAMPTVDTGRFQPRIHFRTLCLLVSLSRGVLARVRPVLFELAGDGLSITSAFMP